MAGKAETKGYVITDTRQRHGSTRGGRDVVSYLVDITTDKGATGAVEVPEAKWNEESLPGILSAFAAKLDLAYTITEE